jgi:tetratricopeptide (TPR) repeat protein
MRFRTIRLVGSAILAAVIISMFGCDALRADESQQSAVPPGTSSVLKIKGPYSSSLSSEGEKTASSALVKPTGNTPAPIKGKTVAKNFPPQAEAPAETDARNVINNSNLEPPLIEESSPVAAKLRTSSQGTVIANKTALPRQARKPSEPLTLKDVAQQNAAPDESEAVESGALATDQARALNEEAELKPIPNPDQSEPVPLEAASFKGVTPGVTKLEEVEKSWGAPKEIFKQNNMMTQLYAVEPFDRVEVCYQGDTVISVVIRFDAPFPADKIAQQLDMAAIRPVLVSNEMGEILGQAYPERGVLFAFEPSEDSGKPSMKVIHIILEPLDAEPFVLRAETELESRYDLSLRDLEAALDLQPKNARVHWLLSRVYSAMDKLEKAEAASAEAVRLEPANPQYRVTRAQILGQTGRFREAIEEAEKAVETSGNRAHIQARAMCLLGDLTASAPKPDYRKALDYHTRAIQLADSLANNPHPAIRLAAKEVLLDGHLGAVHDIAWGDWKEKETSVIKWLERAATFADDLVANEDGSEEHQFRVCTRALSAAVGVGGKIEPQAWIQECLAKGQDLIDSAADPVHKAQYQWDLGMALYDAVQLYQMRSDHASAQKYALAAVEYLEQGHEYKQTPSTAYILGRLYFRLGAIEAIRDQNHAQAVAWFDKAIPLLLKPLPPEAAGDLGRHGETFVSMGVSYWETQQRAKAVKLTQHGIVLMEKAYKQGALDQSALIVPYNNLAAMHRQLGASEDADRYQKMAAKIKDSQVK